MRACPPAVAWLLALGIVSVPGCRTAPTIPTERLPLHLSLRWDSPRSTEASAVDSLTIEVRDAGGALLVRESPAVIRPGNPPTFSDTLSVPLGTGRSLVVRAYSHGDEYYRGSAGGVNVTGSQVVQVEISMRNSLQFSLQAGAGSAALGDTTELTLNLSGFASVRGVQADIDYDARALRMVEARVALSWPGGFDGRERSPGTSRILFYPETLGQLLGPGGAGQALCVLRFVRCPGGSCPGASVPVNFSAIQAVSRHNLSQPADAAGTVVSLQ